MRYSDFVLRIEPPVEGAYPVIVERSPAGKGRGSFRAPFSAGDLHPGRFFGPRAVGRDALARVTPSGFKPEDVGNRLFAALFSGRVGRLFERSIISLGNARDRGLRIRIVIDPEISDDILQSLPWELLRWTERRELLALSPRSPVVRSLSLPRPTRLLRRIDSPLRILAVMADPAGLDLAQEKLALEAALANVPGVEISFLDCATREEISSYLHNRASSDFHVLHYMGHGVFDASTGEGGLRLAGEQGYTPGSALAQILREAPSLRLAVLNGCHTARFSSEEKRDPFDGVAPALLMAGLPAVVAMRHRISDRAAIAFSKAFYSDLAAGEPVEEAVRGGRQAIYSLLPQASEWATPALFLEGSGRLFPRGSAPLRAYLHQMVERLEKLAPPGIPRQGRPPSVLLDSVFVPLHCRRYDPFTFRETPPPQLGIEELPGILAPFGDQRIVLLGGAGSGKTTLLHWIALRHASAKLSKETRLRLNARQADPAIRDEADDEVDAGPARIPILVRLADYNAARRQMPSLSLTAFLGHHLAPGQKKVLGHRGVPLDLDSLHGHLLHSLKEGSALVLLDGLDEIADPGERYDTVREIDRFLEEWLPIRSRRKGAPQVAVASRVAGYSAARLGHGVSHWLLEPLDPPGVSRLSAAWRSALGAGEEPMTMPDFPSPSPDGETPASNPRLATLWTVLQQCGPTAGLRHRVQLYETAATLELDDWRRRCGLEGVSRETLLTALAEWIAESGTLVGDGDLAAKLKRVLPEAQAELAAGSLGAQDGSGGLLHPAFREYLAACWLASDPASAPGRLLERLGEPRWREPLRMALGRMSADLNPGKLEKALLLLLDAEDPLGGLLPRAAALLAAAIPEMIQVPARAVEETASRLIQAWADLSRSGGSPRLLHFLERTFVRLADAAPSSALDHALHQALEEESRDRCLAAAHLSRVSRRATVEIAEALTSALARDREERGWLVDTALRDLASRRPDLLPLRPGMLRWELRRHPGLRQHFQDDPAWQRIGLALYGDSRPEGMYRDSAVTPCLLSALEASPGETLASRLWKASTDSAEETRRDALLSLAALGESVATELRQADPAARRARAHLSRISRALKISVPAAIGPALASLERNAGLLFRNSQGCDWVSALIDVTLAFGGSPLQVLALAKAAPETARPRLLAEVWHCLVAGAHGDPVYNLAVLLDTEGATLASPPLQLAETLALAPASANARWDLQRSWSLDRLAPRPEPGSAGLLSSALDSLAGLDGSFDFVRSWALIVLAPLLREAGLDTEALIFAVESLSDCFNAREEAVRALMGTDAAADGLLAADPGPALHAMALEIGDPVLRLRALLRLAKTRPDLRGELLAEPVPARGLRVWLARRLRPGSTFPALVQEALALPDPSQRSRMLEEISHLDDIHRSRWASLAIRSAQRIRDPEDRAQTRVAPLLLAAERELGEASAPLILGAIVNDLQRELTLPADVPGLWAALIDEDRRTAALAALHDHGRAGGLRLTGDAADALDHLIAAGDLRTATSLLPLLETPQPAALPRIDRWLRHPDPGLRNVSALLLAERQEISEQTAGGLLTLLTDPEERLRHRAALALHGDFSPGRRTLSAARMGSAVLDALAQCWLSQRDQSPGIAKILAWTFERIEHDDGPSLDLWAGRLTQKKPGAPEAEVILSTVERLHPKAEPAFLRGLRNGSPRVQKAFLRATCRLLARGRLRDGFWREIASGLSRLHPEAAGDSVLAGSPAALIDALQEAWQNGPLPELADKALARRIVRLADGLRLDPDETRDAWTRAGLTSRLSGPKIRAAADRIASKPELLAPLLAWLCARLGRDVQDVEPFCPINSDLLALAAVAAERIPRDFLAAASSLPELRPRLREAARLHDSFPGRSAALRLLAAQRRLSHDALIALHSGLRDVAPVQAAALEFLPLYREADPEVLPRLLADLADSNPTIAMASGRLLAILARNGALPPAERKEALRRLVAAGEPRRDVYNLTAAPPLKIFHVGRLDETLYQTLAEISGLEDLLGPETPPSGKETT